jgi:L-fuconolactonase
MLLTRRDFVASSLSGLALPGLGRALPGAEKEAPLPVVDTHTHFYDPTRRQRVPWPSKDDPLLYRPVLPEEFQLLAKPFGVTGTIVVEASSWVEDNQWLLDLATNDPFVYGVVGNLSPGTDSFSRHLARFAKNPVYCGIRVNADVVNKSLDHPEFLTDLKRLIDADLELDVNGGPQMLQIVDRLADRLPELRIVINHLSNVKIDGKEPPATWQAGLNDCATHPKVFLKVSALVESARTDQRPAPSDTAFYHPILNAAWKTFGEDRLIYGSNWPVSDTAGPYKLVFQIVSDFFRDQGQNASEKFFARNAQAAYKWPNRK